MSQQELICRCSCLLFLLLRSQECFNSSLGLTSCKSFTVEKSRLISSAGGQALVSVSLSLLYSLYWSFISSGSLTSCIMFRWNLFLCPVSEVGYITTLRKGQRLICCCSCLLQRSQERFCGSLGLTSCKPFTLRKSRLISSDSSNG